MFPNHTGERLCIILGEFCAIFFQQMYKNSFEACVATYWAFVSELAIQHNFKNTIKEQKIR